MKIFLSCLLILSCVSISAAEPFVVIVRHAEKATNDPKDPELSPEGLARADALAKMLKTSGVASIFTSEFKRTIETGAPTAKALGISPAIVPARDTAALATKLHELKGNALVVGHGN